MKYFWEGFIILYVIKNIFDSWEEFIIIYQYNEVWKKFISTFMDDFERVKTLVEAVIKNVMEMPSKWN